EGRPLGLHRYSELGDRRGRRQLVAHHHLIGVHGRQEGVGPLLRLRRIQQTSAGRGRFLEGGGGPCADGDVVGVPRHPVRSEREDGVGLHLFNDVGQARQRLVGGNV